MSTAFGFGFGLPFQQRRRDLLAEVKAMFANGEQGWLYDYSNLATLFQDSAGTTPVTASGQPVGRVLDLSGRGNHKTQATSTKRPTFNGTRLVYDGVDDSMSSISTIDFSATDSVTLVSALRKESDAAFAIAVEISTVAGGGASNGSFGLQAPNVAAPNFRTISRGTTTSNATASGLAAPISAVISGKFDISSDLNEIYVNGPLASSSSTDQGSGNFGNYTAYFGARKNASAFFTGPQAFNFCIGRALTAAEFAVVQQLAALHIGVTLS